jgi:hypothetical protein
MSYMRARTIKPDSLHPRKRYPCLDPYPWQNERKGWRHRTLEDATRYAPLGDIRFHPRSDDWILKKGLARHDSSAH